MSEHRISIVPLGLMQEPGGCGREPLGTSSAGGELAPSHGIPFAPSCTAAGREDKVVPEEVGGGTWKQWCFWHGPFGS